MSNFGAKFEELKENPNTANIGTKWTEEDDKKLMKIVDNYILNNNEINYNNIALEFKRTIGSIVARIKLNVYRMINDQTNVGELCNKYQINQMDMDFFIEQQSKREREKKSKSTISNNEIHNVLLSFKDEIDEIKRYFKSINSRLKRIEEK
jgi:hypothetical protein